MRHAIKSKFVKTDNRTIISELTNFIFAYRKMYSDFTKTKIAKATAICFNLIKKRSVYSGLFFSIRFSLANTSSFSNVVLSLSTLKHYDDLPFIVCVIRPFSVEFLLSNTTFLKKISHSSQQLRVNNIRGSFLGHDIMRDYSGVPNCPENFATLFAMHQAFTWEETLKRLVKTTGNIAARGVRFDPTPEECEQILSAPARAHIISSREDYEAMKNELRVAIMRKEPEILTAGQIDNVNMRGNLIEQIITKGTDIHNLEDTSRWLDDDTEVKIDIKTKLLYRASSPKAYNIDKALRSLSRGDVLCVFCFIGLDIIEGHVYVQIVSILDKTILGTTRVQFHWAGRNSRGVTQLTGNLSVLFDSSFKEHIDIAVATRFLQRLIDMGR